MITTITKPTITLHFCREGLRLNTLLDEALAETRERRRTNEVFEAYADNFPLLRAYFAHRHTCPLCSLELTR